MAFSLLLGDILVYTLSATEDNLKYHKPFARAKVKANPLEILQGIKGDTQLVARDGIPQCWKVEMEYVVEFR